MNTLARSSLLVVCALLAHSSLASAGFLFVAGEDEAVLERELLRVAATGHRLVAAGAGVDVSGSSRLVALLESVSRVHEYAVITCSGDFSDEPVREAIDALGRAGYRLPAAGVVVQKRPDFWLPDSEYEDQTTLIFERGVPDARFAYVALSFRSYESFHEDLARHRKDGFDILGMWNTGRKLQVVLVKDETSRPAESPGAGAEDQRLILVATRAVAKSKINAAADRGYRIVVTEDPPTTGPPIFLLEKTAAVDARFEYRFTKNLEGRVRKEKLADKLNKRARRGWRLTPGGITDGVLTLERVRTNDPLRPTYRVLSSGKLDDLPESLERATDEGYRFVRLFVEPSRTSVLLAREP